VDLDGGGGAGRVVNLEELPKTKAWWSSTGALNDDGVAEQGSDHSAFQSSLTARLVAGTAPPPLPRGRG